jgi:hypothetical protein
VIVLLTVGGETVVMQACRCCRVGVGVTRYPDGPVRHAERSFHTVILPRPEDGSPIVVPDLCRDCARSLAAHPHSKAAREVIASLQTARVEKDSVTLAQKRTNTRRERS